MPKKPPAPSDIADKFMLRMPDGMRDRIAESAKTNNRSMNSEIIARLDASYSSPLHGRVFGVAMSLTDKERRQASVIASALEKVLRESGLFDPTTEADEN